MKNNIKVAILGSTGYVGMELVKILSLHPNISICFLGSDSEQNKYLTNIDKTHEYNNLPILKDNKSFDPKEADYVFLALPHGISNNFVKKPPTLYEKYRFFKTQNNLFGFVQKKLKHKTT